jgi:hypothetical protein
MTSALTPSALRIHRVSSWFATERELVSPIARTSRPEKTPSRNSTKDELAHRHPLPENDTVDETPNHPSVAFLNGLFEFTDINEICRFHGNSEIYI